MEGPSKPEFEFRTNPDGTISAVYKPNEAGSYKVQIKFQHYHITGKRIVCAILNKNAFMIQIFVNFRKSFPNYGDLI